MEEEQRINKKILDLDKEIKELMSKGLPQGRSFEHFKTLVWKRERLKLREFTTESLQSEHGRLSTAGEKLIGDKELPYGEWLKIIDEEMQRRRKPTPNTGAQTEEAQKEEKEHEATEADQLRGELQTVNRQLAVAQNVALQAAQQLKKQRLKGNLSHDELWKLAEQCRFKSGGVNYSKLGRELHVSYKTAQKRCDDNGIK